MQYWNLTPIDWDGTKQNLTILYQDFCAQLKHASKRGFDIVVAGSALVFLLPLIIVLAILVRIKIGSPIFFQQERPGLNGQPFMLYKFRTMTNERDAEGNLLPDADRITKFGRFLRKSSLDELPELLNVLRGEMSLVGPRPLLMAYLPYYTEREQLRHSIRPGITGLAQVSGRNNLPWNERLELDVKYAEEWSLIMDIKILFMTALQVVRAKNVTVVTCQIDLSELRRNMQIEPSSAKS